MLFETLIDPTTINFPSFSTTFFEANSADIAGAFDNYGFSPTRVNGSERAFLGWTRSFPASNPTAAYAPAFRDFFSPPAVWLFGSALGLMGVVRRKVSA